MPVGEAGLDGGVRVSRVPPLASPTSLCTGRGIVEGFDAATPHRGSTNLGRTALRHVLPPVLDGLPVPAILSYRASSPLPPFRAFAQMRGRRDGIDLGDDPGTDYQVLR